MSGDIVRKLIFGMPTRFNAERAGGLNATIQFKITGEAGGDFAILLSDGVCTVEERLDPSPNLTLKLSGETYVDVAMGRITGPQAFFRRKLKFTGDMALVMKMHVLFPSLEPALQGEGASA